MFVGVDEVTDTGGERGDFEGTAAAAGAAVWVLTGDRARDNPIDERGRELEAAELSRSFKTALAGLTAPNALSSSSAANEGDSTGGGRTDSSCCAHSVSCVAACSGSPESMSCCTTIDMPLRFSCVLRHLMCVLQHTKRGSIDSSNTSKQQLTSADTVAAPCSNPARLSAAQPV